MERVRGHGRETAEGTVPEESFEDALWRADVRAEVDLVVSAAERLERPHATLDEAIAIASALKYQLILIVLALPMAFAEAITNRGLPPKITAGAAGVTVVLAVTSFATFLRVVAARKRLERLIDEALRLE